MRRAIALLSVTKRRHHHIRLNADFRSDMMWWKVFASHWNATAVIIQKGPPDVTITSDASGIWGCGAWCQQRWFRLQWVEFIQKKYIAVKELLPIVIASLIWGPQLAGKHVSSNCDNSAVVSVLNSRTSKDKDMMQLLRCLFFVEAYFQFHLEAHHIPGISNECADDLSRNRLAAFRTKLPQANHYPIPYTLFSFAVAAQAAGGLVLPQLDSAVQYFCENALAESTRKTYQSALLHFAHSTQFFHHFQYLNPCYATSLPIWLVRTYPHKQSKLTSQALDTHRLY